MIPVSITATTDPSPVPDAHASVIEPEPSPTPMPYVSHKFHWAVDHSASLGTDTGCAVSPVAVNKN